MVKKKTVMRILVYALVCVIALSFCGCASNEGDTDTLSDYRPMVFVNDAFYGDSGKTISELPANVNSIGTITNTVSQSAPCRKKIFIPIIVRPEVRYIMMTKFQRKFILSYPR